MRKPLSVPLQENKKRKYLNQQKRNWAGKKDKKARMAIYGTKKQTDKQKGRGRTIELLNKLVSQHRKLL